MISNSEAGLLMCCCTQTECKECGTPGTGEEAEETGYKVLWTTQGVIEETIHQRQALNWNLDFGYSYGTFCPHRVAEITAHRHS